MLKWQILTNPQHFDAFSVSNEMNKRSSSLVICDKHPRDYSLNSDIQLKPMPSIFVKTDGN